METDPESWYWLNIETLPWLYTEFVLPVQDDADITSSGDYILTSSWITEETVLPGPCECTWSNLDVDPTEDVSPFSITVTADVKNTGGETCTSCSAKLKVDGAVVNSKAVSDIAPGVTKTVTFTYDLCAPDTYAVTINDLAATDVVVNPQKGDFDANGDINFDDFVSFGLAYNSVTGDPNYDPIGDFNDDGEINFDDFVNFGLVYGFTC